MLYVKSFNCVNGNKKERSFRSPKIFATLEELEEEREKLRKKFKVDAIDFNKIVDTGKQMPSEEVLKEIFG